MSPFRAIPRAPQATTTSPAPPSSTSTSNRSRTSGATRSTTTTWDTRVGSVVYGTYQPAQTSAPAEETQSSGGLLSSKPGVAGLCAGIAVVCILVAGFFIYRVKFRDPPTQAKVPIPKSSSVPPPSTRPSSKKPPSPFQLGSRSRHPLEDSVSRSNSSSRSLPPSNISSTRAPQTERSYRTAGDVMEASPIRYQHTNSSVTPSASASMYTVTRRTSENGVGGGLISEYKPHSLPSRSFERLSTATESRISMLDSSSYSSRTHLLPQAQLISNTPEPNSMRRPLPVPPHPPPSYEQASVARPLQIMSTIPDTEGKSQAHLDVEPEAFTPSTLVGAQTPNVKAHPRTRISSLNESRQSGAPTLAGLTPVPSPSVATNTAIRGEPAFLRRSVDDADLDMEIAMTPRSHRRHPSSGEHDPFTTMNYDLPNWLHSDPYPAQALRPSTSQPSLYGTPARSAAASSRVLPSDSSTRTLTPEPTSPSLPPPPADAMSPDHGPYTPGRYSRAPTYTSAAASTRTRPLSAVEGDGPPVDEVLVYHGAERPGWAETSPLPSASSSISRSRRHFPTDRFEADDLHPTITTARHSAIVGNSPTVTSIISTGVVGPDNRSTDRDLTFMSLTPLSAAIPGQGQGLSRAFSLDSPSPHRRLFAPRGHGFGRMGVGLMRSPTLDRPFSNISSLQGAGMTSGALSAFEERGRGSMAPSSNLLPSEAVSIRSISPETGWIGYPESAEGHDHGGEQQRELAAISEGEHSQQLQQRASPVSPTSAPVMCDDASGPVGWGRASKMSMGEEGVLWGQLTSAMEKEHPSPS